MKLALFICIYFALVSLCCSLPCVNVVAPTSITASSYEEGHQPYKANDSSLEIGSRWSANGLGQWLTYDLGSSKPVCSVSAAWLMSDSRVYAYKVAVSSDGSTFTTVKSANSSIGPVALQAYSFTQTNARYVRLSVYGNTANSWAHVLEFRVSGPGFVHPGVLVKQSQLDFVRGKIQANQQPWLNHLNNAKNTRFGKTTYVAKPAAVVTCASASYASQNPNDPNKAACSAAKDDGEAAWTLALIWQLTGEKAYATAAINIINSWVNTLKQIKFNGATDLSASNGPLVAGWMAEMWIRAAEVLRHGKSNGSTSGWQATSAAQFGTWTMSVFYPHIRYGWWNGNNWDLTMMDGLINIAVYNNNATLFDSVVNLWKSHVPQYIYMTIDGSKPIVVNGSKNVDETWKFPPKYMNGLAQETCRDLPHTQMGLAAMVNFAETAHIQGTDVYSYHGTRIMTAFEFHAYWITRGNTSVPSNLCGGTLKEVTYFPTWEIFYNHYRGRLGYPLANSTSVVTRIRNNGPYQTNLMSAWEVLTHCGVGNL